MKRRGLVISSLAALAVWWVGGAAIAQEPYPSAPVKLIYGFAPGGGGDAVARILAQKLSAQMNANFFVENKPGANSNIAAAMVAKSKPDGYTLLLNTSSLILSPAMGERLDYDLFKDLVPVALVSSAPLVLFVSPALPVNSFPELIAELKAHPGKLSYGSSGTGGITHLGPLLLLQTIGLKPNDALHVPYKGASGVMVDVASDRVQFGLQTIGSVVPLAKDKRVKMIGVGGLRRWPQLPDVPTLAETLPGFELTAWYGVLAPAKTPPDIVRKLNTEIVKALQDPDTIARLTEQGMEPFGSSPEGYVTYMRTDFERWSKTISDAGVKLE